MSFEERFAKWLQDGREFRGAFRNAIIALERKRDPDIPRVDLEVKANHLMYDLLGWIPEEGDAGFNHGVRVAHKDVTAAGMSKVIGQVMEDLARPIEWGNLFGEGSIDNTIQVTPAVKRVLGTLSELKASLDIEATATPDPREEGYSWGVDVKVSPGIFDSVKLPIVDGAGQHIGDEVIYKTVVVEPSPAQQVKPHATLVQDSGVVGFEEATPLKPVPNAPYERAVVASDLWREIVDEGEMGRTNAQVEGIFDRLQEKYYGKVFLKVKIDGLQVGVMHLNDNGQWVRL